MILFGLLVTKKKDCEKRWWSFFIDFTRIDSFSLKTETTKHIMEFIKEGTEEIVISVFRIQIVNEMEK